MTDLKNILKQDDEMNSEGLMKYLEGKASDAERFAIEKQMADSDFMNDAVEGLQEFTDTKLVRQYTEQLNGQLHARTRGTQRRKKKSRMDSQHWTLIAIAAILLLCVLAYFVIQLYIKK
ncbi:MAG: hypothetical protein NVSMB63_09120 [Sediminibacterium sp.]